MLRGARDASDVSSLLFRSFSPGKKIGKNLAANVRSKLATSNETSTAWRQKKLFSDLDIDVSGEDMKRILDMHNEMLYNGYLIKRWATLNEQGMFNSGTMTLVAYAALLSLFCSGLPGRRSVPGSADVPAGEYPAAH